MNDRPTYRQGIDQDSSSVSSSSAWRGDAENFFILGCPRSGTTLLQVLLNRHPNILIPPETKLFYYFDGMPMWMRRRALSRWRVDLGIRLPESLASRSVSTAEVFQRLYRGYAERCGKHDVSRLGEKTPEQTSRIARIFATFPQARVVLCLRDGRDVANSLSRVPWLRADHLAGITIWQRYVAHCQRWLGCHDARILPVHYEQLVRHPRQQLAAVLRHLGLDDSSPDQLLIRQAHQDKMAFPQHEYAWKHHALQPPSTHSIGLHQRVFSAAEIAEMELLAGRQLTELGYPLSTNTPQLARPWRVQLARMNSLARMAAKLPLESIVSEIYHAKEVRFTKGERWNRRPMHSPAESYSRFRFSPSSCFTTASPEARRSDRWRSD